MNLTALINSINYQAAITAGKSPVKISNKNIVLNSNEESQTINMNDSNAVEASKIDLINHSSLLDNSIKEKNKDIVMNSLVADKDKINSLVFTEKDKMIPIKVYDINKPTENDNTIMVNTISGLESVINKNIYIFYFILISLGLSFFAYIIYIFLSQYKHNRAMFKKHILNEDEDEDIIENDIIKKKSVKKKEKKFVNSLID